MSHQSGHVIIPPKRVAEKTKKAKKDKAYKPKKRG